MPALPDVDGTKYVVVERGGLGAPAFRHRIGTRSLYGQTGSIGAKATNQLVGAAQVRFH